MALRIQNLLKKNFDEPYFTVSCPSWWNSNEQQFLPSLSKNTSFKVDSPNQPYHESKQLGFHLLDQESSSTLSIGQSHNEMSSVGGINSQDQCISSESGSYLWLHKCIQHIIFFIFALH
jgi:nuclear transcription factor Y alpha